MSLTGSKCFLSRLMICVEFSTDHSVTCLLLSVTSDVTTSKSSLRKRTSTSFDHFSYERFAGSAGSPENGAVPDEEKFASPRPSQMANCYSVSRIRGSWRLRLTQIQIESSWLVLHPPPQRHISGAPSPFPAKLITSSGTSRMRLKKTPSPSPAGSRFLDLVTFTFHCGRVSV